MIAAGLATWPAAVGAAEGDGLAGTWSGVWIKAGDALPVKLQFSRSPQGWKGDFQSDALQIAGAPFAEVTYSPPRMRLVLKGDASTTVFEGEVRGAQSRGVFHEGDAKGRFELRRAPRASPPPQSEEVSFASAEAQLAGTLLRPPGAGPHPAVILLHGSGPEGRWASGYLAQRFAQAGFAALAYDKRGVGGSTGDWRATGFGGLADDAAAAAAFLRSRLDIRPDRIGIYGHSQGGTIAPLAAERVGEPAFIIASAASGVSPAATERYSLGNTLRTTTLPADQRAAAREFVRAIVKVAYEGGDRAALDAVVARNRDQPWVFEPPPPANYYWDFSRRIADFDPAEHWRRVRSPVLLLYGENDERVPPLQSAAAIRAALARDGRTTDLIVFPDADHAFQRSAGRPGGWTRKVETYGATVTDWARRMVVGRDADA